MISRRDFLERSALIALAGRFPSGAQAEVTPDYTLEIADTTLELSPRHRLRTTVYNGAAPGPVLRFREGRAVTIEVTNRTERAEIVHWHGLFLPTDVDGAMEEGTPMIPPRGTARLTFTPRPAGFRWYHTHTSAMQDLTRAQYGGQHGFLLIEPSADPGRYDREFFLALHDWSGYLAANEDGAMNPSYAVSTINGKVLGAGEPLRVKPSERVLLHVLNSSPTEVHWVALAGHALQVIALDGNAVPTPQTVPMLRLAPGERVCARVQMNNPGVWILGEVRKHVHAAGMGIVVEYAGASGTPRWQQPSKLLWSYEPFAEQHPASEPPPEATPIPLLIESRFRGHGSMEAWLINGKSYPDTSVTPLESGRRYRLQFINRSTDDHPLHLHRHSFEVRTVGAAIGSPFAPETALRGLKKDVVLVDARTQTEVEFVADNPGATLMHCHQQNHMDLGFMLLLRYA
ncbi:MAG TPA: multicopper oxidase family protein [Steroidobacteraceae bacterium]|nr:multicopper oxidase family protein [Steroidobacteraceae bacterium]